MGYSLKDLTSTQKGDLIADIKSLLQSRKTFDDVTMSDIDALCLVNGIDNDYADTVIKLVQNAFKKKGHSLDEDSIISKTGSDGETSFEAVPDDVARQLNGTTQTDLKGNKTTVKDTGKKTLGEVEGPDKKVLNQQDILNLAKDLDVCTKEALRSTGNDVAYTQMFFNKSKATITIKAAFQENADNPGKPESQDFSYKIAEGKVVLELENGKTVMNVSAIQTQSGTANINRDLATDSIKKAIDKGEVEATGEAGTSEPVKDVTDKPMMEGFGKAVDAYRKNKSKETIKELFRSARAFPGDDIQHKFANAVQAYKCQGMPAGPEECPECQCSDCDLKLSESLFIRLLEFAKEDAKDDVDLHEVAENLARICAEGKCASIEDYPTILGDLAKEDPEDFPKDKQPGEQPVPEDEEPEHLQEADTDPVSKLVPKIGGRPESEYTVYIETGEDRGGYLIRKSSDQTMSKAKVIDFLQNNRDKIEACWMPGKGIVQVEFKVGKNLQENDPGEVENWLSDEPACPGDEIFFYDPETKEVWGEGKLDFEPHREYVTGTISCAGTGKEDLSFSHAFGTQYEYALVCTEVDIEIDGLFKDEEIYDTEDDKAMAKGLLTREDWDIIREWGLETLTDKMA